MDYIAPIHKIQMYVYTYFRDNFIDENTNEPFMEGDLHTRKTLANTLRILAEEGAGAFYAGRLGRQVINELQQLGSEMTMQDFFEYK